MSDPTETSNAAESELEDDVLTDVAGGYLPTPGARPTCP